MEREEISKKIKILRKSRGLTQQQLADRLNVKRATISNYEIGRRSPHLKELEAIAEALGVSLDHFGVGGDDVVDLIARARGIFESETIDAAEKARAYKEIMRLYLELDQS